MAPGPAPEATLTALHAIVGQTRARPATPRDAVDGVQPLAVVEPGSVEEVSQVLRRVRSMGLALVPRGGGTKLGWGGPPRRVDVVLETRRLDRVLDHASGDLVVSAQAGVGLAGLQGILAAAGQWLALDPPGAGATLGGVVATGASGPRRHRFGTPRDLLIGITVVLADGAVARAGGKVVKNVAGYDLGKLFSGSLGTLGIIVETTLRLHPRPPDRRLVLVEIVSPEAAGAAVQELLHSSLVPSAVELCWSTANAGCMAVLFEGVSRGVSAQADTALSQLRAHGPTSILEGERIDAAWAEHTALPYGPGDLGLKIGATPSDLPRVIRAVFGLSRERSLSARIAGRAGVGVLHVGLSGGGAEAQGDVVVALRQELVSRGATVVVLQAAPELKRRVDAWGPAGNALELMRRVKQQFDPDGMLSPGRFVGGI
jgi:glycolate oxidase FAD binding subunit